MPTFTYQSRSSGGASQSGAVDAASEAEALQKLRAEGMTVTEIRLTSAMANIEALRTKHATRDVKREDVIAFSAQLSVMLETGVPLSESLAAFLEQSRPGGFRRVIEIVADRINSGVSFSTSLREFPKAFPPLMISLLLASEATGALATMLGRVADYLGQERKMLKQIKGALMYPIVMVTMAITVTVFLVGWVLPRFAKIYEARSATLPMPTRILMSISGFLTENWLPLLLGVAASVTCIVLFTKSKRGIRIIDWMKINAPVLGTVFNNFYLSRASRTLGTLLAAGVTLPDAVRIVRDVTGNVYWAELWDDMERSMTVGGTVAEVVLASKILSPPVSQMIAAGERTGQLPKVLERIASVSREDLDEAIKNSTQMIEPLVITFMGALIGAIAIALLLPIMTMGTVIGKG